MTLARLGAVTNRHQPVRAPGIARALAVLMLLAGIVAMHSAVFGTAHASDSAHAQQALTVAPSGPSVTRPAGTNEHSADHATEHSTPDSPVLAGAPPAAVTLPAAAPADPHTGCGATGCEEHAAVHGCVFVLAALAIALTLVLLYRLGDTAEAARHTSTAWRGRRERPPPWTVLTLSQLAILRI
ncbi:hypothetical protein ATK86_4172 [Nocardia fluminea]|uniref:Uncharacterized protein n=1 Tax=Nocardia fluminea TaxID=134984 RepID=A0A2N3VDQ7_9NOCA|nr:hypothetical protein ATK86_4172 [Nocardia fluminea]